MKSQTRKSGTWLSALGICGMLVSGCVFGDNSAEAPKDGPKSVAAQKCADLSPAQQKTGDSLVVLAQNLQASEVEMMVSSNKDWNVVNESKVKQSLSLYNQALAKAPGHCGAIFGRALAQGQLLLQDKELNQLVGDAMQNGAAKSAASGSVSAESKPVAKAFKAGAGDAAPLVLRVSSGLSNVSKPFISSQQDRIAKELLPDLDSIIASMDAVMAKEDFSFTFTSDDGTPIEIDAGEVGPLLGGFKIARAILLVVCGYNWELADQGSYAWIDQASNINPRDFKSLAPSQKAALDHLTSLFQPGNAFSKIKPAWKESVNGIPALLLQAVDNTITGLKYGIYEASHPGTQVNDLYRVGTGENDDVDPKDLAKVVDALDRTKKYLKGEVTLTYHNGTHSIKLNFPKVFALDGLQNYLPYFTVRPYQDWGILRAAADTTDNIWEGQPFYFTDASGKKTMEPRDLRKIVDDLGPSALTGKIVFRDPTFGGIFPELTNDNIWSTVNSLDKVQHRVDKVCNDQGCVTNLPENASDLDTWIGYLFWADNIL